jgi:hypothetical protein
VFWHTSILLPLHCPPTIRTLSKADERFFRTDSLSVFSVEEESLPSIIL